MRKPVRTASLLALSLLAGLCGYYLSPPLAASLAPSPHASTHARTPVAPSTTAPRVTFASAASLLSPSEGPSRLTCQQATAIIRQARANLALPPARIPANQFAASVIDWLDPHGLWSASSDSPVKAEIQRQAPALLIALENDSSSRSCPCTQHVGFVLRSWIAKLRGMFQHAEQHARKDASLNNRLWWTAASDPAFEAGEVKRPAVTLARSLGRSVGMLATSLPARDAEAISSAALRRFFPDLTAKQWSEAVLSAAVRAYVIQLDPHGGWAPVDEETSLYDVELEQSGRHHMWSAMSRTAAGLVVNKGALFPLLNRDVVISIEGHMTAGLSVEQAQQLAVLDPVSGNKWKPVTVLRDGSPLPLKLLAPVDAQQAQSSAAPPATARKIRYGNGYVAVVHVPTVPDDLGVELGDALANSQQTGQLLGVLLDLRGNAGGSIDGAEAALSLFLPGAPLFPMRRRSDSVEVDFAPLVPAKHQWTGPVATLVDGGTASAAEMIAGALRAYHRGPVLGRRTFGKGCAQEYLDDAAGAGVLRLSTFIYSLPNGSPVQREGITPDIFLALAPFPNREANLPRCLAPWRGPDVRAKSLIRPVPWPHHGGHFGPCGDRTVCVALSKLGGYRPTPRATRRGVGHHHISYITN